MYTHTLQVTENIEIYLTKSSQIGWGDSRQSEIAAQYDALMKMNFLGNNDNQIWKDRFFIAVEI